MSERFDVVIFGAGQAGLTLARHLLLETGKTVLLLDRQPVPPERQKVGESSVQVSGYYLSKVLDLEEYLLRNHFMKYNLRFYWKTPGREGSSYGDYGAGYIRKFSNVASYQLDRNRLEGDLLAMNRESPRFAFAAPVGDLEVDLAEDGDGHRVRFTDGGARREVEAGWVVDASGRHRVLAKKLGLKRPNPIRHGASFCWVEGLVDVEKLTDLTARQRRTRPDRTKTGHLPTWLATNHFMGDGFWFWVIPLRGKTSLGVVFDRETFPRERVAGGKKLIEWACEQFPLFARDLPHREVLDFGGYRDFSYDCSRALGDGWALTGEAGRFSDPLYSPGGDLIAFHNTLIVDLVETADRTERESKLRLYDRLLRSVYDAYVPSYALTYGVLGDQEAFCLKYVWELTVYFGFYVFPFINERFTDRRFATAWMSRFARLGPINHGVQKLLADFLAWKRAAGLAAPPEPRFFDFLSAGPLARSEEAFYRVGLPLAELRRELDRQLANLEQAARWIAAHAASVVVGDVAVLTDRAFVEGLDPARLAFDPEDIRRRWAECAGTAGRYDWGFDPEVLAALGLSAGAPPAAGGDPGGGEEPAAVLAGEVTP